MQRYRAAIGELICHLVRRHRAQVTLVSTCQGIPEYWMDDSKTAVAIHEALPVEVAQRVIVDRVFRSPTQLIEMLSAFDLAVATRMHFSILSMIAEVPTIAIAYEFKTTELFRALDLEHLLADIENVTAQNLCAMCDQVLLSHRFEKGRLHDKMPQWRDRALDAAHLVLNAIAETKRHYIPFGPKT